MAPSLKELLGNVDLFADVPAEVIADLINAGATFTTPAGQTMISQGSSSGGLLVILEGSARVLVDGVERPEMPAGAYLGEISVIDGRERSATVIAGDGGMKTFAISPLNFSKLIDRHPGLARCLLKALCARVRALEAGTRG